MSDTEKNNWKVIYTGSRQEKKVAIQLDKTEIEYYLPLVKQLRVWSDRKKWIEMPLFNGYLFVRPVGTERDEVLAVPGVVRYLRYNGTDGQVTEQEIAIIRSLILRGYDISEYDGSEIFEPGDKVKIISGPMKDYEGEILTHSGDKYAFLVLQNFGHTVKIKLPKQVVRRVN